MPDTNSFWSDGATAYGEILQEEETLALAPLKKRFLAESDTQAKRKIQGQIDGIKAVYEQKRKQAKKR